MKSLVYGIQQYKFVRHTMIKIIHSLAAFLFSSVQRQERVQQRRADQGWREIHAAVALTNLAQGQSSAADQSCVTEPSAATEQSCSREPFSFTRTTIRDSSCITGPTTALTQSYTPGPALTSRIIQKSSHISEVQTVNVALPNSV